MTGPPLCCQALQRWAPPWAVSPLNETPSSVTLALLPTNRPPPAPHSAPVPDRAVRAVVNPGSALCECVTDRQIIDCDIAGCDNEAAVLAGTVDRVAVPFDDERNASCEVYCVD